MATSITVTLTANDLPPVAPTTEHIAQTTVSDVRERLLSRLGGNPAGDAQSDINRAIADAWRELPNLYNWTHFLSAYRIMMSAPYSMGTVEYDHTGGAYEHMLTLTDGTWPTWAARGYVRIGTVIAWVKERISDTILTLEDSMNFQQDIAAGTSYEIAQDSYPMPPDFTSCERGLPEDNWNVMVYNRPSEWLTSQRFLQVSSGQPYYYTFMADSKNPGRLCMRIFPPPYEAKTLDLLYRRSPRPIRVWDRNKGRASIVAGSNQITLSNGGFFQDTDAGTVIRLSSNASDLPTSNEGLNPYAVERTVTKVLTSTTALLDDNVADTYNAVAYRISDPIDCEPTAMMNVFHAGCIRQLAMGRDRKELSDATTNWRFQLDLAKEADIRNSSRDSASLETRWQQRLANMPLGPME